MSRARAGRLRIVGSGENHVDTTYIDNAAQAHFDAFDHLAPGAACAGKAYFISNGEPWPMRKLLNALLETADAPHVDKHLSFKAAYRAACAPTSAVPRDHAVDGSDTAFRTGQGRWSSP